MTEIKRTKIRDMAELATPTGAEFVPVARNGSNYKLLLSALAEYIYKVSGAAGSLNALSDVNLSNPQDGQPLVYNAETKEWINSKSTLAGGSLLPFTDVLDGEAQAAVTIVEGAPSAEVSLDSSAIYYMTDAKQFVLVIDPSQIGVDGGATEGYTKFKNSDTYNKYTENIAAARKDVVFYNETLDAFQRVGEEAMLMIMDSETIKEAIAGSAMKLVDEEEQDVLTIDANAATLLRKLIVKNGVDGEDILTVDGNGTTAEGTFAVKNGDAEALKVTDSGTDVRGALTVTADSVDEEKVTIDNGGVTSAIGNDENWSINGTGLANLNGIELRECIESKDGETVVWSIDNTGKAAFKEISVDGVVVSTPATKDKDGLLSKDDKANLDKLMVFYEGTDTDETINSWKELEEFLKDSDNTQNLAELLKGKADKTVVDGLATNVNDVDQRLAALGVTVDEHKGKIETIEDKILGMSGDISNKQDTIGDLTEIRTNAALGKEANDWGNHAEAGYALEKDIPSLDGYINNVSEEGTGNAFTSYRKNGNSLVLQRATFLTGITSQMVTAALGYTPYDESNPNGYITSSALDGLATQEALDATNKDVEANLAEIMNLGKSLGNTNEEILALKDDLTVTNAQVSTNKTDIASLQTKFDELGSSYADKDEFDDLFENVSKLVDQVTGIDETVNSINGDYLSKNKGGAVIGDVEFIGKVELSNTFTYIGGTRISGSDDNKLFVWDSDNSASRVLTEADGKFGEYTKTDDLGTLASLDIISNDNIKDAAVTTSKIKDGAITSDKLSLAIQQQLGWIPSTTDDLPEGSTHLYFTEARAQTAVEGLYLPIDGTAKAAETAWSAFSASHADSAGKATNDADGNAITTTYLKVADYNESIEDLATKEYVNGQGFVKDSLFVKLTIKNASDGEIVYTPYNNAPISVKIDKSFVGLGNVANSTYAGGTAVTLNGTSKASSTASFYAPTSAGTSGYVLRSNGSGAPKWDSLDTLKTSLGLGSLAFESSLTTSDIPDLSGTYLTVDGAANYARTLGWPSFYGNTTTVPGDFKMAWNVVASYDAGSLPHSGNANGIITMNTHSGNYHHQLGFTGIGVYYRKFHGVAMDTTTAWSKLLMSDADGNVTIDGTLTVAQQLTAKSAVRFESTLQIGSDTSYTLCDGASLGGYNLNSETNKVAETWHITPQGAADFSSLTVGGDGIMTQGHVTEINDRLSSLESSKPDTADVLLKGYAAEYTSTETITPNLPTSYPDDRWYLVRRCTANGTTSLLVNIPWTDTIVDISGKADKATTLAGYGITDAYTKSAVDGKITFINTSISSLQESVVDHEERLASVLGIANSNADRLDSVEEQLNGINMPDVSGFIKDSDTGIAALGIHEVTSRGNAGKVVFGDSNTSSSQPIYALRHYSGDTLKWSLSNRTSNNCPIFNATALYVQSGSSAHKVLTEADGKFSDYLPLTGGTMTSGAGIFNRNDTGAQGAIGFNTDHNALGSVTFPTKLRTSTEIDVIKGNSTYTLLHSGNVSTYAVTSNTVPAAKNLYYGGIKIGYTESDKNYAVKLDTNGKAYVTVPWTEYELDAYLQDKGEASMLTITNLYTTTISTEGDYIRRSGNSELWKLTNYGSSNNPMFTKPLYVQDGSTYSLLATQSWVSTNYHPKTAVDTTPTIGSTNLVTSGGVETRVRELEEDITDRNYLTSSSTLASANLDKNAITIVGTSVALGESITMNQLIANLGLKNLAFKDSLSKSDVGLGNVANSTYAGGTAVTLNGTSKASSTASFYAPTSAGTSGYVLRSNGSGAPKWDSLDTLKTSLGLGSLAFESSLTTSDIPDLSGTYLTVDGAANYARTLGWPSFYGNTTTVPGDFKMAWNVVASYDAGSLPYSNNANGIITMNTHSGNFHHQLGFTGKGVYHRKFYGVAMDTTTAWSKLLTSDADGNVTIDGTLTAGGQGGIAITNSSTGTDDISNTATNNWRIDGYGYVYCRSVIDSSDETRKNIIGNTELTVSQIANAPAVDFYWKNGMDADKHVGTIAQYWKNVLPEVVRGEEGSMGLDYATLGVVSAIVLARNIETHEQRIARLEDENVEMKEENVALRAEIVALKAVIESLKQSA